MSEQGAYKEVLAGWRARREAMVEEYKAGDTLESIGKRHGVSRQRVDQVLKKFGVERRARGASKVTWRCAGCGREEAMVPGIARRRKYCSTGCAKDHIQRKRVFSNEELVAFLHDLAGQLGHTPSLREINASTGPSHTTYVYHFGSLRAAQIAAGLEPNRVGQRPKP